MKTVLKIKSKLGVTAASIAIIASVAFGNIAQAESFGIHFLGNDANQVTGIAGVKPVSGWNNIANSSFTSGSISSSDGLVSATLAMSGNGRTLGWNSGITADGGSGSLMRGYNDAGVNNSVTDTISGLTGSAYSVFLYTQGDTKRPANGTDGLPNYTINGTRYYTATMGGGGTFPGFKQGGVTFANSNTYPTALTYGNYIEIDNVVPVNGAITISANSDNGAWRSPLNGIEIVAGATKGVYVGSEFYIPTSTWQANAQNSGFTRLFLFTLSVASNGDISYNGTNVAQNGVYVGDSTWGAKLAACKAAPSSVTRIEAVIGGWGSSSFANIKSLIASQGTGTGSILYKNFVALKNATGVDAIQYDDESTYDVNSMVSFGNMLSGVGLKVTLCPYTQQSVWVSVKSQLGNKVDSIYLQCYDGGAGNDPGNWNSAFGGFKVQPGLWGNTDTSTSATSKFRNWVNTLGITGGFMWLNGALPGDAQKWSASVRLGLDPVVTVANGTYKLIVRHSGQALDVAGAGTGNNASVDQWPYSGASNQRWTLTSIGNGQYKLIGAGSGRSLNVSGASTSDNANIVIWDYSGAENEVFGLASPANGYYTPIFVCSGKALAVSGSSTAAGASVVQYTYNGAQNEQWQFLAP